MWENLKQGASGIDYITLFDASEFHTKIAGEVKNFSVTDFGEDPSDWQYCGRNIEFAVAAAKQAISDSGYRDENVPAERVGVYLGAGEGAAKISSTSSI